MGLKLWRLLSLSLLVFTLAVGLSPLGIHLMLSLVRGQVADAGFELTVADASGSLLQGVGLEQVRIEDEHSWVTIDTVQISLWQWRSQMKGVRARWQLASQADTRSPAAEDLRPSLPDLSILDDLPALSIGAVAIDIVEGDSLLWRGPGLQVEWQPPGRVPGRLDLTTSGWLSTPEGPVRVAADLFAVPRDQVVRIHMQEISFREMSVGGEDFQAMVRGSLVIGLMGAMPMETDLGATLTFGELEGRGDQDLSIPDIWQVNEQVQLTGTLWPVSLAGIFSYEGETPWISSIAGDGRIRADRSSLWLDSLAGVVAEGQLAASGVLQLDEGFTGTASLTGFDIGTLLAPLSGRADARVTLASSLQGQRIDIDVAAPAVGGLARDAVDLQVSAQMVNGDLRATASSDVLGQLAAQGTLGDTGRLDLAGDLQGEAWLGRPTPFALTGHAAWPELDVALESGSFPFGADPGTVLAQLHLGANRQLEIKAQAGSGRLMAMAVLDLNTSRFDTLHVAARQFDLRRWDPTLQGMLDGELGGRGVLGFGAETQGGIRIDSLQLADWQVAGPVEVSAHSSQGRLHLGARGDGLDLSLSAAVDCVNVEGRFPGLRLQRQADSVFVRGRVRGSTPWKDLLRPTLSLSIDSMSIHRADLFAYTLESIQVETRPESFDMTDAHLSTTIGEATLKALRRGRQWSISSWVDSLQLAPWKAWEATQGRARVDIAGALPYPTITASVDADALLLQGHDLGPLSVQVDIDEPGTRVSLQMGADSSSALHARLSAPGHLLDAATRAQQVARLQVTAEDYVAHAATPGQRNDSTSVRLTGQLDVALPLSQIAKDPDWSHWQGQAAIDQFWIQRPTGGLRLRDRASVRLDSGALVVDALSLEMEVDRLDTAVVPTVGSVELSGRLDTMVSNLRLRLRDVDLQSAATLLGSATDLSGLISAEAVFTGTPARPALDVEGSAQLDELGLLTVRAKGRPLGWNVLAKWQTPAQDELTASIGIPPDSLGWPDWRDGTMRLRSSGIELTALLDQWGELDDLAGRVEVDLAVSNLLQPRLRGEIDVVALQLALLDMTPGYRFAAGQIYFDDASHGRLVGFAGTSTEGSGRLELSGTLRLPTFLTPELDLHLLLDDVPYRYADIFDVDDVDADLTWEQRGDGGRLSGFLRLNQPTAQVQLVDLTAAVAPPPSVQSELMEQTQLDLFIDIDELQTLSEISDVVLDGGIRIYGTLSKPRFQGELDIQEGHLLLLSRRFEFDRGRIITDRLLPTYSVLDIAYDPLLLDPELDLQATALVYDLSSDTEREVSLELRGTAQETAPILTSPGLGDNEVLNLLAFGDPIAEQGGGNVLYAAAGQLLLSRQARRVGLDEFQLLSSGSVLGATIGKSSVRVGKYLDWPLSVWLRYEGLASHMATGQLEAEYRVTKLLKIDARTNSDRGVYGIGIVLEKDF
ncbi:MAG: hypothetical protein HOB49_29460 [Gemmatimonadetes bacterium]|nr:hypothetical protein [Gemmatimonadota bacterium]